MRRENETKQQATISCHFQNLSCVSNYETKKHQETRKTLKNPNTKKKRKKI